VPGLAMYRRTLLATISPLKWSQLLDNRTLIGLNELFVDISEPLS
jgi:hypothetical protein